MSAVTPNSLPEGTISTIPDGENSLTQSVDRIKKVDPWLDRIAKSIAKSRRIRGGNYVQIATVDEQGLPHCRTVVFRGFLKDQPITLMKMITDARSEKVQQIRYNSNCEMVWWFSESSEQYRIRGRLLLCGEDDEAYRKCRIDTWKSLSDPAREQFYWVSPGLYDPELSKSNVIPAQGRNAEGTILPPPENFLLMLLAPTSVKYLRLSDNLAIRDDVVISNDAAGQTVEDWTTNRINP